MQKLFTFLFPFLLFSSCNLSAQNAKTSCIAFYNLENLFDTIDAPHVRDEDFLPDGYYGWTNEKYQTKLNNLSKVISILGDTDEIQFNGPTFLGVCEIENEMVLNDLTNTELLKPINYEVVHYNSPDKRGIDVAFLYKKAEFTVLSSKTFELVDKSDPDRKTRDQLLITGIHYGDTLNFIVNHWPSRRAGDEKRVQAAKLCRSIVDSLLNKNENAKIFVMGDFNDTPLNKSLNYLSHQSTKKKSKKCTNKLHNEGLKWQNNGLGTIEYKDVWDVFDMILVSPNLMIENSGFQFKSSEIFDRDFLHQHGGRYDGYPNRTHAGSKYLGGYSDHLPVYMHIVK